MDRIPVLSLGDVLLVSIQVDQYFFETLSYPIIPCPVIGAPNMVALHSSTRTRPSSVIVRDTVPVSSIGVAPALGQDLILIV